MTSAAGPVEQDAKPASRDSLRHRLLLAAERVVALRGFSGATVREIHQMAGTRNTSAINYHYGSLETLLAAVFEFRSTASPAASRRAKSGIREIVSALVTGLATHLQPREEGNHYLRFLERAVVESRTARHIVPANVLNIWHDAEHMLREAIGADLPVDLRDVRIAFALCQFVSTLALIEAWIESDGKRVVHLPMLTQAAIDSAVAILSAPVSDELARQSRLSHERGDAAWQIIE